jgi:hypothetical protein
LAEKRKEKGRVSFPRDFAVISTPTRKDVLICLSSLPPQRGSGVGTWGKTGEETSHLLPSPFYQKLWTIKY